jgi:hypothetical protein
VPARAASCNICGLWDAPLLLLGQNNSPAKQVSTPQSDVRLLWSVHLVILENKKIPRLLTALTASYDGGLLLLSR